MIIYARNQIKSEMKLTKIMCRLIKPVLQFYRAGKYEKLMKKLVPKKLSLLHAGMSQEDVHAIFGDPDGIHYGKKLYSSQKCKMDGDLNLDESADNREAYLCKGFQIGIYYSNNNVISYSGSVEPSLIEGYIWDSKIPGPAHYILRRQESKNKRRLKRMSQTEIEGLLCEKISMESVKKFIRLFVIEMPQGRDCIKDSNRMCHFVKVVREHGRCQMVADLKAVFDQTKDRKTSIPLFELYPAIDRLAVGYAYLYPEVADKIGFISVVLMKHCGANIE